MVLKKIKYFRRSCYLQHNLYTKKKTLDHIYIKKKIIIILDYKIMINLKLKAAGSNDLRYFLALILLTLINQSIIKKC